VALSAKLYGLPVTAATVEAAAAQKQDKKHNNQDRTHGNLPTAKAVLNMQAVYLTWRKPMRSKTAPFDGVAVIVCIQKPGGRCRKVWP
jgi:hypothetical protein